MGKFSMVFSFYLNQLFKFFLLMKRIPVTDFMSLFDLFIVTSIIGCIILIIKMGYYFNRTYEVYTNLSSIIHKNKYIGKHSGEFFAKHKKNNRR